MKWGSYDQIWLHSTCDATMAEYTAPNVKLIIIAFDDDFYSVIIR
jgi:hypothetical protein